MIYQEQIITSRNNPLVKWACTLTDTKGRNASSSFMIEGEKLTYEALETGLPITNILISESKKERIFERIKKHDASEIHKNVSVTVLSDDAFNKISTEKAPQGVISIIKHLDFFNKLDIIYKEDFFLREDEKAIMLCSVRDPGNLGSVIRSSVAFGVQHVILTSDCADVYNPKVARSAMGSLFRIKITIVDDALSLISALKEQGRRVFAAELTEDAISLGNARITSSDIVIIGNEGHGIPKDISNECTSSVYIPISNKTESLNASVAAAIFMWEISK